MYPMLSKTSGAHADEMNEDCKRVVFIGLLEMGEGLLAIK